MLVAMSFLTFGQRWTALGSDEPTQPQVELVSSSEEQIVVNFSLGGFDTIKVETPDGIQNIISVPKMAPALTAGVPNLAALPNPCTHRRHGRNGCQGDRCTVHRFQH